MDSHTPLSETLATTSRHLKGLAEIGVQTVGDLLNYFPRAYSDFSQLRKISEVVLGEERYRIINLVGNEQIVALQNNQRYYLLEVAGNSMNSSVPEPINHGDYVLMRNQNTANNQDIIAAEIVGIDESRATLKRYKKGSGSRILLLPESNDFRFQTPIYLEREFSEFDSDFSIRGMAIAVFKKITV